MDRNIKVVSEPMQRKFAVEKLDYRTWGANLETQVWYCRRLPCEERKYSSVHLFAAHLKQFHNLNLPATVMGRSVSAFSSKLCLSPSGTSNSTFGIRSCNVGPSSTFPHGSQGLEEQGGPHMTLRSRWKETKAAKKIELRSHFTMPRWQRLVSPVGPKAPILARVLIHLVIDDLSKLLDIDCWTALIELVDDDRQVALLCEELETQHDSDPRDWKVRELREDSRAIQTIFSPMDNSLIKLDTARLGLFPCRAQIATDTLRYFEYEKRRQMWLKNETFNFSSALFYYREWKADHKVSIIATATERLWDDLVLKEKLTEGEAFGKGGFMEKIIDTSDDSDNEPSLSTWGKFESDDDDDAAMITDSVEEVHLTVAGTGEGLSSRVPSPEDATADLNDYFIIPLDHSSPTSSPKTIHRSPHAQGKKCAGGKRTASQMMDNHPPCLLTNLRRLVHEVASVQESLVLGGVPSDADEGGKRIPQESKLFPTPANETEVHVVDVLAVDEKLDRPDATVSGSSPLPVALPEQPLAQDTVDMKEVTVDMPCAIDGCEFPA